MVNGPISLRQTGVFDLARDQGAIQVDARAWRFQVTPQTIRKDLNDLCDRGLLQRAHGGAVPSSGVANFAHAARLHHGHLQLAVRSVEHGKPSPTRRLPL